MGVADDALFPKVFREANPDKLVAEKRERYRGSLEATPPILQPTIDFIGELATHFPLAVVSSSARIEVQPAIVRAGLGGCFRMLITREDVDRIKPDPQPYRIAAARMHSIRPLVIEDSASGIAAGKAAGFPVVVVSSPQAMPIEVRAALGL